MAQDNAPEKLFVENVFESAEGGQLPYRLLSPPKIEAGKEYPLVLFLHGAGERANDFIRLQDRFPAYVIFPQCPEEQKWVETDWALKSGSGAFPETASDSMSMALSVVDQIIAENPVDADRTYVCGLSMGGYGTWFAAASKSKRFVAAIPVCGGGDPTWANRYAGVSIWATHCDADAAVPIVRSREMVAAIATEGHWPEIRFTEYPGVGHDSWTQTFANDEVFQWLFSQRRAE